MLSLRRISPRLNAGLLCARPLSTSLQRLSAASAAAETPVVTTPSPKLPPRQKRGIFRRIFRLLAFGAVSGTAYFGYKIWDATHYPDQIPTDDTKPRLVILGSGWGAVALIKSIDTANYNVTVISPRNYFLFTPLLPSTATGLIEQRSIMEPTRAILRKKRAASRFVEGEVTHIDPIRRSVNVAVKEPDDEALASLGRKTQEIPFDKLVIAVGSDVSTFGIPGVKEHACFLKEVSHAQQIRKQVMDCIEGASFPNLDPEERKRLLHTVVVGGGPTGVEFAGELHDFFANDLKKFAPDVVKDFKVTLVEALPSVLPSFSKLLIDYTEETFQRENIEILTKTMVNNVNETKIYAKRTLPNGDKEDIILPYGTLVWAGGVKVRKVVADLFPAVPEQNGQRRGLKVDDYLQVVGTKDIYAVGDCADAGLAPTAQVASQEGLYLGELLNRQARVLELQEKLHSIPVTDEREARLFERRIARLKDQPKFKYSHQGALAYIGSEKAVADIAWQGQQFSLSGYLTFIFWRSAYLSMVFSLRNKLLVGLDWVKVFLFGRDVSRE